ncbi:MAG TPA: aromatic ring-hydroxylating dioxygenase subunit alpha [Stellaceae bacterium]|nr:aromatic ring-hydroxylating dioxygenase subunit alpha [Stellaceae bacterium]
MTKRSSAPISADARSLPAAAYTSAEFFDAEGTHVHRRGWFFVGRADEVSAPGDYRAIDTVAGPVILLRDLAGELRAFANCCRHRGSRLLAGSGNRRAIVCPYHGWGYRLDGSLAGAPDMERTPGFRASEQGLVPLRMALWQGFVFLALDAGAPALADVIGNMPAVFASHRLDEMECTWRAELDARCNWKLLVENAMESYHTGYIHAATVGAQTSIDIETTGDWECLQVLDDRSIAVLGETPPPFPPIEGLSAEAQRGTYFSLILPTTQFAVAQDSMWWLQVRPLAADRSILSLGGCFPRSTVTRADFEEKARPYYDRWLRVAQEDVGMLEIQQVGLGSALHRPGLLSWREALVARIDRWIMERIPESLRPM